MLTRQNQFLIYCSRGIKNAEFYAEFKSVEKYSPKNLREKILTIRLKVKKLNFFFTFYLLIFGGELIGNFLNRLKRSKKCTIFDTPNRIFVK